MYINPLIKKQLRVEYRPIQHLKPDPKNPRTHTPEQIGRIAKLIKELGWTNPILVDGKNGILAGHGRYQAARQLGIRTVPVIELEGLTPAQKRAYLVADNQAAAKAGWDEDLLRAEFRALKDMGFDLELTGFDLSEIGRILELEPTPPAEPPTPAARERAVSRTGDLWCLGEHRVACGDSTKKAALEALTGGRQAQTVFTDPPYGVSYVARSGEFEMIAGDNLRRGQLADLLRKAFAAALPSTKENAGWYVWHASQTKEDYAVALRDCGLVELGQIIWAKPQMVLGWSDYRWAHEPCIYAARQGVKPGWFGERDQTTIWRVAARTVDGAQHTDVGQGLTLTTQDKGELYIGAHSPKGRKVRHVHVAPGETVLLSAGAGDQDLWEVSRDNGHGQKNALHANQKPVELARRAIRNSSRVGDVVLDMFAGSASTLMAAEQLGRIGYMLELDPIYVDVAVRRWQEFTKRDAYHAKESRTFAQLAKARAKAKT